MTVPDGKKAEGFQDFFKRTGEATVHFGETVANSQARALVIASNIGASKISKDPGKFL